MMVMRAAHHAAAYMASGKADRRGTSFL